MKPRTRLVLVFAVGLLTAAMAVPAVAVTYSRTFAGTRDSSGACVITGSGSIAVDQVVTAKSVSFDNSNCTATYSMTVDAVGSAARQASSAAAMPNTAGGTALTADYSSAGPASAGTSAIGTAAPAGARASYLRTFYEDPVGLDVSSLRVDAESYNCGFKAKRNAWWLSTDGWTLAKSGTDHTGYTCTAAFSQSGEWFMHIYGFVLCVPQWIDTHFGSDTDPTYDRVSINNSTGGIKYYFADRKASTFGCDALLSHNFTVSSETPW